MRQATASATRGLALAATLLGSAAAQAQTAAADNTSAYRSVYETSQTIFDQCGDVARSDLYRRVVREKVDPCPFTEVEKADFQTWAAARGVRFAGDSAQAASQGPVPGAPDAVRHCTALAADVNMREARRRLDRYGRGEADVDEVIQEACRPAQP